MVQKLNRTATVRQVAKVSAKQCKIVILLPDQPVDLYVEGELIRSYVSKQMEMMTPELANGSFKYNLVLKDSHDAAKTVTHVVRGIKAGQVVTVDLRNAKPQVG